MPTAVIKAWKALKVSIEKQIKSMNESITNLISQNCKLNQDYKNLQTIPVISSTTAIAILAEIPSEAAFKNARQLAAYAGLTPSHKTSGSSVKSKAKLSKIGSCALRKSLYFPAIVAQRFNPIIKQFCDKLKSKGKHNMTVIGAAMRKLLHIVYGVLKNKTPFDINFIPNNV